MIGQGSTFGGKNYPDNKQIKLRILEYGFDNGINFVDTGEYYEGGIAEEVVGEFIKGKRDKVIVSDKFKAANNNNVIQSCEESLKRLRTDYIDLYQIQWPNYEVPIEETIDALLELIKQGKVKEFGVCNFTLNEFRALPDRVCSLQTEFNLQNRTALDYHTSKTLIGYNIFNQGFIEPPPYIYNLSVKYNKTPHQIIFAWAISKGFLMLTNTMNIEHLKENIEELKLEHIDINLIDNSYSPPVEIPTDKIKIEQQQIDHAHKVYTSLEEVIKNADKIHPNPFILAEEIKKNGLLKPIEIRQNGDGYYNLLHGSARYFAWIIAHNDKPIPAFIL